MGSIQLQDILKEYGSQVVLEDLSLEIRTGERVGLVGANGAGKTTLFRLISGLEAPNRGTVTRTKNLGVGMLSQEPQLDSGRTLHEEVGHAFEPLLKLESQLLDLSHLMAEHHDGPKLSELMAEYDKLHARFEAGGGYGFQTRLNEILGGLGFSQADHQLPISALSGGQKCRAALGKLLLEDQQLLLLDEPTNHLDIAATRWLEKFLVGHHGGSVIISHDRYLLDKLATKIIEVERRRISVYPGNYSNFVKVKALRTLTDQRRYENDKEFIEKERAFIAKHIARQRGKEAKGRRTRLERRIASGEFVLEAPKQKNATRFRFKEVDLRADHSVLVCRGLSKRYDDKVLFGGLNLEVRPQDRLGITGSNGTGKSTLLKIALGQVEQDEGTVQLSSRGQAGYYDQEHADLDRSKNVLETVVESRPDLSETQIRSFLGSFLFTGDDVFKPIGKLSGGEQSRTRLAKLILSEPELLILDEPTNHLDIPSREVLEAALTGYTGTIIVVSHDRYFLDRIATRMLMIEHTGHNLYEGNYSYYVEEAERKREAEELQKQPSSRSPKKKQRPTSSASSKQDAQFDALTLSQIEGRIVAGEDELAALHERFADESIYRDPEASRELKSQVKSLQDQLGELNAAWEQRIDQESA